jgi:ATP-dependent DNA helicase RecG
MDAAPLDTASVRVLLTRGEGETIEFKKSLAETDTALRTLSAFASQDGGTVLFGISPNGKPVGLTLGFDSLERLSQAIQAKIEPRIFPRLITHEIEDLTICSVTVQPDGRVHSAEGRYYARVGRTTQLLTTDELKRRLLAELNPSASSDRRPDLRVGFLSLTAPTELASQVTLYPMWPDGIEHLSTVEGVRVRTYNQGDGTARRVLLTFQLPPGVAPWSVTGYKADMNAAVRGYREPSIYTYNIDALNPGVHITVEFYFRVMPGMTNFKLDYSVAMEDEQAVSGQLTAQLDQSAVTLMSARPALSPGPLDPAE